MRWHWGKSNENHTATDNITVYQLRFTNMLKHKWLNSLTSIFVLDLNILSAISKGFNGQMCASQDRRSTDSSPLDLHSALPNGVMEYMWPQLSYQFESNSKLHKENILRFSPLIIKRHFILRHQSWILTFFRDILHPTNLEQLCILMKA